MRLRNNAIYAVLMIFIMCFNIASVTQNMVSAKESDSSRLNPANERFYPGWDLPQKIAVIYDANDTLLTTTALNVLSSASIVYHNTFLISVTDWNGLHSTIIDENYWIKMYFIKGTIAGVDIGGELVKWQQIADALAIATGSYHIFGSGSTDRLRALVPVEHTHVHIEGSPVIGAEQSFFYNLWEIGEIMALDPAPCYQRVAEDFRILGAKYFSENLDRLTKGVIDPDNIPNPLGEEDVEARRKAFEQEIAEASDIEQVLLDGSTRRLDNETALPESSESIVELVRQNASQMVSPYLIGIIPKASGLEGAAGDIIDLILALFPTFGFDKIRLNSDVALEIIGLIGKLSLFMSNTNEGSGMIKETWRSLIETVTATAPIPVDLQVFLYHFVEAYHVLRGEPEDILDLTEALLVTIFETVGTMDNSTIMDAILSTLETSLLNITELNASLALAEQQASDNGIEFAPMNEAVNFVLEKVLNFTTYSWFAEISGGIGPADKLNADKIMNLIAPLVRAAIVGNFEDLMEEIPFTFEYIFNKTFNLELTTNEKSASEVIARIYHLAMVLFDQFSPEGGKMSYWTAQSIIELFKELMSAAMPILGENPLATSTITKIVNFVNDLKIAYNDASIDLVNNQNILKSEIRSLFAKYSLPSSPEGQALVDALGWLGAIWVPTINEPSASDLRTLGKAFFNVVTSGTNATIINLREEILFTVIDATFSVFALMKDAKAAQKLLIDDINNMEGFILEGGENSTATLTFEDKQALFGQRVKMALVKLISLYAQEYTISDNSVQIFAEFLATTVQIALMGEGKSVKTYLRTVATQAAVLFFDEFFGVDSTVTMKNIQGLFAFSVGQNILGGIDFYDERLTSSVLKLYVEQSLITKFPNISISDLNEAKKGVSYLFKIKDLFTGGVDYILQQYDMALTEFLNDLGSAFTTEALGIVWDRPLLRFKAKTAMTGADFVGVFFWIELWIGLTIEWDDNAFVAWIEDLIYKGLKDFDLDPVDFFLKILSFVKCCPFIYTDLGVTSMSSGKGGLFASLLENFGLKLEVTGSAGFKIEMFNFSVAGFEPESIFKVLDFHFAFVIKLIKEITLFEIVSGGAPAGPLAKAAKYLGLDSIKLNIWLSVTFGITLTNPFGGGPVKTLLTFILGIGAYIKLGIDIAIIELSISFGLDIFLYFFQDLTPGVSAPLKIVLDLILWVRVTIEFLFFEWEREFSWRPGLFPLDLSPPPGDPELKANALGFDGDNDGLTDAFEEISPSLDPTKWDTDGDLLSDKFEVKVSMTDPGLPDTDADGLSDFMEWRGFRTNPLLPDTDLDGLTDYEEVVLYYTNPLSRDSDSDGLTDTYEVTIPWNMTGITPSVTAVRIGGKTYNDRTDPLDPDTDDDGLLDGQEGSFGPYFGDPNNYNGTDQPALIFGGGYTHPLDNDTDDDSYYQYYDGSIADTGLGPVYLRDMRDGVEIAGITATIIEVDPDGFMSYVTKVFQTNPCNPDTDGDTGIEPIGREAEEGFFLNSDGYELSIDPATDPLDGDSDDDGLIDGLEGTLQPERNYTTFALNPDTDGDGLPDGIEVCLGSDPGNPDTDNDLILDGDEFFRYFTNPLMPDTDFDGVDDYWELFFSHSSPHSADTDGDGLSDFDEIFIYGTDPVDDDSDNDDLDDRDEVFEYGTDPADADSDGDRLRDGTEINEYNTDPNKIDTDNDSILSPNEDGDATFLWTDYDEIMYGTNPILYDSDDDGIPDGWELYLAQGEIPNFENIPLDPLDNDTDNDGIIDGKELLILEVDILVYPFIGFETYQPYLSSPVRADTDGDGLGDKYEIDNFMRPDLTDSDNDSLSDWQELYTHLTDPRSNDTDGDGIPDPHELTAAGRSAKSLQGYDPQFNTSALDPDSDDDGWPDGLECGLYATDNDPRYDETNPDVNNNGIPDGYERDFDSDLISDGDEYYTYNSYGYDGGFLDYRNPDSDYDGLLDGDEILVYGTQPFNPDTDYDGYSDSLELWIGTNPLIATSEDEFLAAVNRKTSPLQITSPEHGSYHTPGNIAVSMFNLTALATDQVYFRYRKADTNQTSGWSTWTENIPLYYQGYSRWSSSVNFLDPGISFDPGYYELQVSGLALNYSYPASPETQMSIVLENTVFFTVNETVPFNIADWLPIIAVGGIGFCVIVLAVAIWIWRRRQLV
ncbi:MAG: hypothetical protein ACFFC7_06925 [Candidatus Hermodarchaeota archaeon]